MFDELIVRQLAQAIKTRGDELGCSIAPGTEDEALARAALEFLRGFLADEAIAAHVAKAMENTMMPSEAERETNFNAKAILAQIKQHEQEIEALHAALRAYRVAKSGQEIAPYATFLRTGEARSNATAQVGQAGEEAESVASPHPVKEPPHAP